MDDRGTLDDLTGGQHRTPGRTDSPALRRLWLAGFLLLTMGGGILIGAGTPPGDWYADLRKPFFNPPDWLFGPVWTVLYAMVAVAGWRTWMRGYKGLPMQIWFVQLAANFAWSPAFFGLQRPGLALIIVLAMGALTALFIARTWTADRASALLMAPYMAWVGFAGLLNLAIWWMN